MTEDEAFQKRVGRMRAGEQEAFTEFVRFYEPELKRCARAQMVDPGLEREFDSSDICQSVMKSFLTPAALRECRVESPEDMMKLLVTMVGNKLKDRVRRARALKRDYRRLTVEGLPLDRAAYGLTPAQEAESRELYLVVRGWLSAREIEIWELRESRTDWRAIAERLDGSAEAVRKELKRAFRRVVERVQTNEF